MIAISPPEQGVTRIHMWTRVGKAFRFTVSAYLVDGILIDTGFPRAAPELASLLDERTVRGAMITHSHEDHAGNAALLGQRGVPLAGGTRGEYSALNFVRAVHAARQHPPTSPTR